MKVCLTGTEWHELQVLFDRATKFSYGGGDGIPDDPPWPAGSPGRAIQKMRALLKRVNERNTPKEPT